MPPALLKTAHIQAHLAKKEQLGKSHQHVKYWALARARVGLGMTFCEDVGQHLHGKEVPLSVSLSEIPKCSSFLSCTQDVILAWVGGSLAS